MAMVEPHDLPFPLSPDSLDARIIAFVRSQGEPAWLVGGYVRDRLLGRATHDLDIIVPQGGIRLARAIASEFGGGFFILDDERDVGRAVLRGATSRPLDVDVARLRVPDLLGDLALRDFTINAMAAAISDGPHRRSPAASPAAALVDPFDGQGDTDRKVIRAVSEGSFRDDPLRMLRGVRQQVELGFRIEDATADLIRRDAALLGSVAAERVRDELVRIIPAPGGWQHLRTLAALDLLRPVLPEAAAMVGIDQSPPHYQDVFDHTRSVLAHLEGIYAVLWPDDGYAQRAAAPGDSTVLADAAQWAEIADVLAPFAADLRAHLMAALSAGRVRRDWLAWAGLTHDWGKPAMRVVDPDGRIRYLEHDHWGALLVERRSQALKLSADETAYLATVTDQHMRPGYLARDYPPSRRAVYHFFRDAGNMGPDTVLLGLADHLAIHASSPDPEHRGRRLKTTELLLTAYFREHDLRVDPPPLLNGHDIMAAFGLAPGPDIGRLLEELREAQAVGQVATADEARAWLAGRLEG